MPLINRDAPKTQGLAPRNNGMKRPGFFAPFGRDDNQPLTRADIIFTACSAAIALGFLLYFLVR
jgi:hypothetical protein